MKLKLIVKPGSHAPVNTIHDVRVVDAETGEPLEWVRAVRFSIGEDSVADLVVEVLAFEVEIESEGDVIPVPSRPKPID